MRRIVSTALAGCAAIALAGCDGNPLARQAETKSEAEVAQAEFPQRVYWGDSHLHTDNSIDAYGFGTRLGPEEALRFARGEEVTSTLGLKARLARPLDWLAITDHSEGLGGTKALAEAPRILIRDPVMKRWHDLLNSGPAGSQRAVAEIIDARARDKMPPAMMDSDVGEKRTRSIWDAVPPLTRAAICSSRSEASSSSDFAKATRLPDATHAQYDREAAR